MKNLIRIIVYLGGVLLLSDVYSQDLTVSVIIPCVPRHAPYLRNLLSHYAQQTQLPYEIIISLSQSSLIYKEMIDYLCNMAWPFKLTFIYNQGKALPGHNRNLAARKATGDILMFQDADDIPHPQRIEIVKYFFERYNICHLMHFFALSNSEESIYIVWDLQKNKSERSDMFVPYEKTSVPFSFLKSYSADIPATNGNPCVLRTLFSKIKWPCNYSQGEDVEYNRAVCSAHPDKTIIVEVPLILYRNYLSSYS